MTPNAFIARLERLWVGQPLPCPARAEESAELDPTYLPYRPGYEPAAPAPGDFGWLRSAGEPPRFDGEPATTLGAPVPGVHLATPLEPAALADRFGGDVPDDLATFAASDDLAGLVPTVTDCYLDLADHAVDVPGGRLVHLLADSQGVVHWLLHVAGDGAQAVLCTDQWIGYDFGAETPSFDPDGPFPFAVVAGSFTEFVWRFWLDNTIWLLNEAGLPLSPTEQRYVESLEPSVDA